MHLPAQAQAYVPADVSNATASGGFCTTDLQRACGSIRHNGESLYMPERRQPGPLQNLCRGGRRVARYPCL